MEAGFYVVRIPHRSMGMRLTIESVRFVSAEAASGWRDFIAGGHPK